jgi:hypothetical protein
MCVSVSVCGLSIFKLCLRVSACMRACVHVFGERGCNVDASRGRARAREREREGARARARELKDTDL